MGELEAIYNSVLEGNSGAVQAGVKAALSSGLPGERILREGMIVAMGEVGRLFEANELFVPEMLVSARAMQSGLALLKPYLAQDGSAAAGKVVVGTVKGDLHDIGKNLVAMMLEGSGFEVIDLGADVSAQRFVQAVVEHRAQVVGMSALLTTTMVNMADTVRALQEAGVREQVKVLVGGAPVTNEFATRIGADGYAADASSAVRLTKSLLARTEG